MSRVAIWAQLEAKPEKEKGWKNFLSLRSRWRSVNRAHSIVRLKWDGKYGIFDTFADENGRNAHLNGEIAKSVLPKPRIFFPNRPMSPSRRSSLRNQRGPDPVPVAFRFEEPGGAFQTLTTFPIDY